MDPGELLAPAEPRVGQLELEQGAFRERRQQLTV
jgi:hypothetical protein